MARKKASMAAVAAATAPEDDFVGSAPRSAGTRIAKEPRVRVSLDMAPSLHKAAKLAALQADKSLIDWLNELVRKELDE